MSVDEKNRGGGKSSVDKAREFRKLKSLWYKKLKESGFEDIEHTDPTRATEFTNVVTTSRPNRLTDKGYAESRIFDAPFKAAYFRRAERIAREMVGQIVPSWVQMAAALHAAGVAYRPIKKITGAAMQHVSGVLKSVRQKVYEDQ